MTLTLKLKPEVEAGLAAHAQATGLSIEEYATQVLEDLGVERPASQLSGEERARAFEEFVESFSSTANLPEEAFDRENWSPDR